MQRKNAINWFEIPTSDLERAIRFYNQILAAELKREEMDEVKMAIFPYEQTEDSVGGCLISHPNCIPSKEGVLIYLNGGEDLSFILNRVERAGGKIVKPKTLLNEQIGCIAFFEDSEGNVVGLHSRK